MCGTQIKPRRPGRPPHSADAAPSDGFDAEKQRLLESLSEAAGDLERIESEDELYRKLYMHGDHKPGTSPEMLAGGWTRSGGQSSHHLPPPPMDTASWRVRASSALPGGDCVPPRPERWMPWAITDSQHAESTLPRPRLDRNPLVRHASPSRSGLILDAGGQAVKDTKFAVENGFSSFLSTVDFIGDGIRSAAGAPSVAARGFHQMRSSSIQPLSAHGMNSTDADAQVSGLGPVTRALVYRAELHADKQTCKLSFN